jgi:hypothetical protein
MAAKALENFMFGLSFGLGFAIAFNILNVIAGLLHAPAALH